MKLEKLDDEEMKTLQIAIGIYIASKETLNALESELEKQGHSDAEIMTRTQPISTKLSCLYKDIYNVSSEIAYALHNEKYYTKLKEVYFTAKQ